MIECTYTRIHQNLGFTLNDIKEMIFKLTGIKNIYIVPVQTDNILYKTARTKLLDYELEDSIFKTLDILSSKYLNEAIVSTNIDIIYYLLKKMKSTNFCPAGINQIAFFVDGNLYPCYRFCNDKRFGIGINNFIDNNKFTSWQNSFLKQKNCKNTDKCNKCEFKNLCTTCIAIDNVPLDDSTCERKRLFLEGILNKIIDIYFSKNKEIFIQNFNNWLISLGL